jgi:hypothetical protein
MTYETLPIEILCDIFLVLCDNRAIDLQKLEITSRFDEFPWAVGQVCRHWRAGFISYPALWVECQIKCQNPLYGLGNNEGLPVHR